jgi:hypothetical protein
MYKGGVQNPPFLGNTSPKPLESQQYQPMWMLFVIKEFSWGDRLSLGKV